MHARTTTAVAILAGAALALTGCSSRSHDTPVHSTTAATVQAAPTTPAPSPTPTSFDLGSPEHWSDGTGVTGTTTAIEYKQPVLQSDPPDPSLGVPQGSQWGRLTIKVCLAAGDSIHVTQDPWHVQFADGSQADQTGLFGGDFPKPEFPQDGTVQPGSCALGGIMFPAPKGQRPAQAVYSPDSAPSPVYWTIPASS